MGMSEFHAMRVRPHAQAHVPYLMCMACMELQARGGEGHQSLGGLNADSQGQRIASKISQLRKESGGHLPPGQVSEGGGSGRLP